MKVSIIIPTYNGREKIIRCLNAILKQRQPPNEIIVIIDGGNDDTARLITDELVVPSGAPKVIVREKKNGGRACARNFGAKIASFELLLFVDDDIEVSEDFVEKHLLLQKNNTNAIISGPAYQDVAAGKNKDFFLFRRHREEKWIESFPRDSVYKGRLASTAQLSILKDVFWKLGGFSADLRDAEDFYFIVNASDSGVPILFDFSCTVSHCDYSDLEGFIKRNVEYYLARRVLRKLDPHLEQRFPEVFSEPKLGSAMAAALRYILIYREFWRIVIDSSLFALLPKKIRFVLYDVIISSSVIYELRSKKE